MHVHVYTMDHPKLYQTRMKDSLVYKVFNHTFDLNAILCCPFKGAGSVVITCNLLLFVTPIVGVCKCSLFCCTLLSVHSSFAIIFIGKTLLSLSSWCLVNVVRLFLAVPWVCLQFVIVVFPDHTHLLFS